MNITIKPTHLLLIIIIIEISMNFSHFSLY